MKCRICLLAAMLAAQAHAADLSEVLRLAEESDPLYAAARGAYRADLEAVPQGRALLFPSLRLSGETTYNEADFDLTGDFGGVPLIGGERSFNQRGFALTLLQPIFNKESFAAYRQSQARERQAEGVIALARQELLLRVTSAYFEVLRAEDNATLSRAQKDAIAGQLAAAKKRFDIGSATIVDANEAQARFDLVSAQLIAAENDLEMARRALQRIIGVLPPVLAPLGDSVPLTPPDPPDMQSWVDAAVTQNPQVRASQELVSVARQEIERNRAGHYPSLDLVAGYSDVTASGGVTFNVGSETTNRSVGLQVNWPLYLGGAVNSRVREALARLEETQARLEDARRAATLAAQEAFMGVQSGVARVRALSQALVSGQSSLQSTQRGLEVGVRTSLDLLDAQQQVFSARRDLAAARYAYILSQLQLEAAAGRLTNADIQEVNRLLEPTDANATAGNAGGPRPGATAGAGDGNDPGAARPPRRE